MTKILQITIVSVAILVAGFFGFSSFFGEKKENIDKFLDSADAISKFKSENGKKQKNNQTRVSPLVKEAKQFALYLDPPPPPVIVTPNAGSNKGGQRPVAVQAPPVLIIKYDLLATIVDTARPGESRALVDLPGEGQKVVKPGQEVGRTIIEEIKNGSIMVKAGARTEELMAKKTPVPSLIRGASNNIFKLFPDLKTTGAHLSSLENITEGGSASDRLTTSNPPTGLNPPAGLTRPTSSSRVASVKSSVKASTSAASRYKAPSRGISSQSIPPKQTAEQEEKEMKELLAQLSKIKNEDGTDMGAEMKNLMKTVEGASNTPNNEQKKADPNKPE